MLSITRLTELKIPLSPSQIEPVRQWLATFVLKEENWARYPHLDGTYLCISAMCFPFFLGYVNRRDSNEFDVLRLKRLGMQEIRRQFTGTLSPSASRYLRKALDNLEFIAIGEFLAEANALPTPF